VSESTAFSWPAVLGQLLRGQHLSEDQAAAAMGSILSGEATPAQIAAFAIGLRIKGESAAEVTGFVRAMLAAAALVEVPGPLLDTCGTGGDRAGTFNVSPGGGRVRVSRSARPRHRSSAGQSEQGVGKRRSGRACLAGPDRVDAG
jgi:anthranilate phosphoribosyltransferase